MKGRGVDSKHLTGHSVSDDTVSTFSFDYMVLTEDIEIVSENEPALGKIASGKPILVAVDRLTGAIFGHRVRCKGSAAKCAVRRLQSDLGDWIGILLALAASCAALGINNLCVLETCSRIYVC